ncbi:MAG TPA: FHA domain-containing protein [Verrucomicrobiae bacterium]|nr:FHA domain-containing protein [Verrucomicrobiae bacterium]
MIQLRILSGKMAGEIVFVRHFPFRIGRASDNELRLEDDGIWDNHLAIWFEKQDGFVLTTAPDAFTAVNEQPQQNIRLRNGDVISFGSAKVQFWLAPASLRGLRLREAFVWLLLAGLTLVQIVLMFKLRR